MTAPISVSVHGTQVRIRVPIPGTTRTVDLTADPGIARQMSRHLLDAAISAELTAEDQTRGVGS